MPTVPRLTGPTVAPTPLNLPQQRFVPSTGLQSLGQSLQDAAQVAGRIQLEDDRVAAVEAERKLGELENELLNDPEKGAFNRQGKNAAGVGKETLEQYRRRAAEIETQLPSNRSKRVMRESLGKRSLDLQRRLHTYEMTERERHADGEHGAFLERSIEDAAQNNPDPERISEELNRQRAAIGQYAARKGWSDVERDQALEEAHSKTYAAIIGRMLEKGDVGRAQGYFDATQERFNEATRSRIAADLEQGQAAQQEEKLRGHSQQASDQILQRFTDRGTALGEARKIQDAKLRDEVERRINQRFDQDKVIENERQARTFDNAARLIEQGQGVDAIDPRAWLYLEPTQRRALEERQRQLTNGTKPETDWETYHELRERASSDPSGFAKENMLSYRTKLSDVEFKQLIDLQEKMKTPGAESEVLTLQQQLGQAHDLLGFKSKDIEKKGRFDSSVTQAVAAEQKERGRKLTFEERQKVLDRMMLQGEVSSGSLFVPDANRRYYEIAGSEEAQRFEVEIPKAERPKIEAALKRAGMPVTEAAIARLYARKAGIR